MAGANGQIGKDRRALLNALNNSNIPAALNSLKAALLEGVIRQFPGLNQPTGERTVEEMKIDDRRLLNNFGPAAAASAIQHTLEVCAKDSINFPNLANRISNQGITHNLSIVQNDDYVSGYPSFSNVLRQFLLPRYAYLDFDQVVDPRHQIDVECGYPKFITPIMYRYMYDRDDISCRVVDIFPDETWAAEPEVYEYEEEDKWSPFELAWKKLVDEYNVLQFLYRIDCLSGVGHYGALLLGVGDGEDLEKPIDEKELLAGMKFSIAKQPRDLLYMRPFDEYLSFIHQYETDVMHPRYGMVKFYNLVFLDMTIDAAGASIGTRLNRRVHWTRVVHVADNLRSSLVFGRPRMQPVFNRLLDLRKIKGGSAEMLWKGGFPGIAFEVDPEYVADQPEFNEEDFKRKVSEYEDGLQRWLFLMGIKAHNLAPQVADPKEHIRLQMEAIACHMGIPLRIMLGSEEGRLASSQDKLTWNQRLKKRCRMHTEPNVIRNFIHRMIAIGCMPPPESGRFFVDWGDLNTATDEDRANLALKYSQACSQYVASGMIHLISPVDYFTIFLGLKPRDALRLDKYMRESGGWEKLKKVDPSQGSGVNGKRQNMTSSDSDEGKTPKRNTADKQVEGMKG